MRKSYKQQGGEARRNYNAFKVATRRARETSTKNNKSENKIKS